MASVIVRPAVAVRPVTTSRERKLFLGLPWKFHSTDPNWVPPLRRDQIELVNYKPHPFYLRNEIQTFLAWRGAEVVGRIAAIINRDHIEANKEEIGFFGFFECRDDQEAANALFDAARAWLAERGLHRIRGPASPSSNYVWAMLIDGFDSPPTFMLAYNPPYYPKLVEGYGFAKVQDMFAYIGNRDMMPRIAAKLGPLAQQIIERFKVNVRTLRKSHFLEDVLAFLDVYNRATAGNWGYSPMSVEEIRHAAANLKYLLVPEFAAAAEVDGRIVGAVFALPDYNPRIKAINGSLFPFGWIRLLWNKRGVKRARALSTNVLPEYQLMGLPLALGAALLPPALNSKIEELEFSWVLESNTRSRGALEKGGAIKVKTWRMYDYPPPAPE